MHNQCKHLYKIKMPTQVVYYDEIRNGKTCKRLKIKDLNCKKLKWEHRNNLLPNEGLRILH